MAGCPPLRWKQAAVAIVVVATVLVAVSPLYRDFALDRRDRYRGASFAVHLGPLDYDGEVIRQFTPGKWFWDPYRSMGMPRLQDLGMRPLYPISLGLAAALPALDAWHWNHVVHVLAKLVGLVLLCLALKFSPWVTVAATTGAMLAEGSLVQFTDTTLILSAAWLPLQLWLTYMAARRPRFSGWDVAWTVLAALRVVSFHPQFGAYYEVLIALFMLRVEWGTLRARWPMLALRYVAVGLLVAPALLPGFVHYLESGRRHIAELEDWHFRRAYLWWNYGFRWSTLPTVALAPWGLWVLVGAVLLALRRRLYATIMWPVFAAYIVFGLFHAVPWLALPMWLTKIAVLPFRLPERVFEPLTWLGVMLLAEAVSRETRRGARRALATVLVAGVLLCLWQTQHDPREAYIHPRWERPLPTGLAALARQAPLTHSVFLTAPDRMPDALAPLLNGNHADLLRVPAAHFAGQLPAHAFNRMAYRVPGLILLPRGPTDVLQWDAVVDVYAELGIGWVFWDGGDEPAHPRLERAGAEHGFHLYRVRNARPMVWAADRTRVLARPALAADVSRLVFSLPALGPFCYGCPALGPGADAGVTLATDWRPGDVKVDVNAPQGALVVLNETRSSGWRVTVDGARVQPYPVNEAFQGVWVPAGRHRVHWTFASPGFSAGLLMSGAGVGLVAGAVLWTRRRPDAA